MIDCPLFPDTASESFAQERCRRLWSIVYQKEPYDIMSTFYKFPGAGSGIGNPGGNAQVHPVDDLDGGLDDLVAAIAKQSTFYYYVSQPHMWEDSFLHASVERYKCFLQLLSKRASKGKHLGCVPTFDIDLIWHAHQLSPVAYAKDTKALLGSVADHDYGAVEKGPKGIALIGLETLLPHWQRFLMVPFVV